MVETANQGIPQTKETGTVRCGPSLRNQDLSSCNFRGRDLQGADLRGANLQGSDLRGADVFGARIDGADLRACRLEMTRLVEVWIPATLNVEIANQIRAFDFKHIMTRYVGPNRSSEKLACPYKTAHLRPLLYEWGSKTWRFGAEWQPPEHQWTLEEIIGAVLDELGCQHDLASPFISRQSKKDRESRQLQSS